MIGVRLKTKKAADVLNKCFENGLLILTAKDKLRFLPPLNISYEQIDKGLAILKKFLTRNNYKNVKCRGDLWSPAICHKIGNYQRPKVAPTILLQ